METWVPSTIPSKSCAVVSFQQRNPRNTHVSIQPGSWYNHKNTFLTIKFRLYFSPPNSQPAHQFSHLHSVNASYTISFSSSSFHSTSLGHLFSDASNRANPRSINSLIIKPLVFASSLLESAFHRRDLSSLQYIVTAHDALAVGVRSGMLVLAYPTRIISEEFEVAAFVDSSLLEEESWL